MSRQQPAARGAEHRDGRHGDHRLERQAALRPHVRPRSPGGPRPSIPLADTDGNPDTAPDPGWQPLVNTPCHPEYPAGHPSQNGAAATVLLSHFDDEQMFTLTTSRPAEPHLHEHRAGALGREQRPGLGRHALSRAPSRSAMPWARRSPTTSIATRCSATSERTTELSECARLRRRPAEPVQSALGEEPCHAQTCDRSFVAARACCRRTSPPRRG